MPEGFARFGQERVTGMIGDNVFELIGAKLERDRQSVGLRDVPRGLVSGGELRVGAHQPPPDP